MTKGNKLSFLYSLSGLTIGVFVMAIGINSFLSPFNIAPGGVTGFAVAVKSLTGIEIYTTNIAVNIPLFIISLLILGTSFGWRTLYATGMLSVFLKIIPFKIPCNNLILAAILGGIFVGFGIGTVFSSGGTTGGTDLIATIVKHYIPKLKVTNLMMLVDGMIIIFAVIVEKNFVIAIASIISMLTLTRVIAFILEKNIYKGFFLKGMENA